MASSEFTRSLRWQVGQAKEKDAEAAARAASDAGDMVAAAHHVARAHAFHNSNPDALREVDDEVVNQLRKSLGHPDPEVRASARQGLEELEAYGR